YRSYALDSHAQVRHGLTRRAGQPPQSQIAPARIAARQIGPQSIKLPFPKLWGRRGRRCDNGEIAIEFLVEECVRQLWVGMLPELCHQPLSGPVPTVQV